MIKLKVERIVTGRLMPSTESAPDVREMVFYAGTPVIRFDRNNRPFHLSFALAPEAVDFSLLSTGKAPFVIDHVEDIDHHLGVIERAWLDGVGKATVRFSDRQEFQGIIGDIKSGVIANVSMGAELIEVGKADSIEGSVPHLRATKWRPYHVSAVSRGADHNAHFLSANCVDIPQDLLFEASAASGAEKTKALHELALRERRWRVLGDFKEKA